MAQERQKYDQNNDQKEPNQPQFDPNWSPEQQSQGLGLKYLHENHICTGAMGDVGSRTFRVFVEGTQLRIPLFQRRYCWGKEQCKKLLDDIQAARAWGHSIGRALVHKMQNQPKDSATQLTIIDGQQRSTTMMLMLASARDILMASGKATEVVRMIDRVLFLSQTALTSPLTDALRHFRLVPTHFDQVAFYKALMHPNSIPSPSDVPSNAVTAAKDFFLEQFQLMPLGKLQHLPERILDRVNVLQFGVREFDLMTMYERLAIKDQVYWRTSGGVSLAAMDLSRNLLLSYFVDDAQRQEAFFQLWVPFETMCMDKNGKTDPERMHDLFSRFLQAIRVGELPSHLPPPSAIRPSNQGGQQHLALLPPPRACSARDWVRAGKEAFMETKDPMKKTGVDLLGGTYAKLKRFMVAVLSEHAAPTLEARQHSYLVAKEAMCMLYNFACGDS